MFQENILVYRENENYINCMWYIVYKIKYHFYYTNLRKYFLYQEKLQFLGYITSLRKILIKEQYLKLIHNKFKPLSI